MPRPVLIDLYYTLIEPAPDLGWFHDSAGLLGVTAKQLQAAASPSFDDRMTGAVASAEAVIDRMLAELGRGEIEPELYRELVAKRWEYFHGITLFPDALPALDALRAGGHKLALVTNCSVETSHTLERLELARRFDALALSCDVRSAKPDPAIYQHAIDALGIDPATAVYVGDGDTDEHAGAARFGMTTVLLQRPGAKIRQVAADWTIASLAELPGLPPLREPADG